MAAPLPTVCDHSNMGHPQAALDAEIELSLEPRLVAAAASFSQRHAQWSSRATRLLAGLSTTGGTACHFADTFEIATQRVRSNRLFFDLPVDEAAKAIAPRRPRKRWQIDESIWRGRPANSATEAYFEGSRSLQRLLMADWAVAQRSKALCACT